MSSKNQNTHTQEHIPTEICRDKPRSPLRIHEHQSIVLELKGLKGSYGDLQCVEGIGAQRLMHLKLWSWSEADCFILGHPFQLCKRLEAIYLIFFGSIDAMKIVCGSSIEAMDMG